MRLSCFVPSQLIPKSSVAHLADKQILKKHIQSYPKITVSKKQNKTNKQKTKQKKGGGGGALDTWYMDYDDEFQKRIHSCRCHSATHLEAVHYVHYVCMGVGSRGGGGGGSKTIITLGRAKRGGGRSPNTIITWGGGGSGSGEGAKTVITWRGRGGGAKTTTTLGGGGKTTITTPPNSHYVEGCVTPCTRLYKRVNWPQNCCGLYVPIRIRVKWLRFVTHLRVLPTQRPTNGGAGTNQKPWVVWSHEFCRGTGTSSLVLFGQLQTACGSSSSAVWWSSESSYREFDPRSRQGEGKKKMFLFRVNASTDVSACLAFLCSTH